MKDLEAYIRTCRELDAKKAQLKQTGNKDVAQDIFDYAVFSQNMRDKCFKMFGCVLGTSYGKVVVAICMCSNFILHEGTWVETCCISQLPTSCVKLSIMGKSNTGKQVTDVYFVEVGLNFDFLMRLYCYSHFEKRIQYDNEIYLTSSAKDSMEMLKDEFIKAESIIDKMIAILS